MEERIASRAGTIGAATAVRVRLRGVGGTQRLQRSLRPLARARAQAVEVESVCLVFP